MMANRIAVRDIEADVVGMCDRLKNGTSNVFIMLWHRGYTCAQIATILAAAACNPHLTQIEIKRPLDIPIRHPFATSTPCAPDMIYQSLLKMCLLRNWQLRSLTLNQCALSHAGILDVVSLVHICPMLVALDIRGGDCRLALVEDVSRLLMRNTSLRLVTCFFKEYPQRTDVDVPTLTRIRANLAANKALTSFKFGIDSYLIQSYIEILGRFDKKCSLLDVYNQLVEDNARRAVHMHTIRGNSGVPLDIMDVEKVSHWVFMGINEQTEADFIRYINGRVEGGFANACRSYREFEFHDICMDQGLPAMLVDMCLGVKRLTFINCDIRSVADPS
jgi:hypothetical protein